jgi:predicted RND superfamily exporter protein
MTPGIPTALLRTFWNRLARAQHAHPFRVTAVAALMALLAVPLLLRLKVDADLRAVLPDSAQSVRDMDTIRASMPATTTLALAVQATGDPPDKKALHAFVRKLSAELAARKDLQIVAVDWNVADFQQFVEKNRLLYADQSDLVALRDAFQARIAWEKREADPTDLDDDGPEPDPTPAIERLKRHGDEARAKAARFPDGFFEHPTLPMDFVFVRTTIRPGEADPIDKLVAGVEASATKAYGRPPLRSRVAKTDVGWASDSIRIDYGAELMDMNEENAALAGDAVKSGAVTIALLLAVVVIFFGRVRSIPLLLAALAPPCMVTFGVSQLVVHQLNSSTAFLGSIVVGNGVNASVMWLGRYFEERRGGKDVVSAIEAAHAGTAAGTFAATVAAMLAYGSLLVTGYHGFRDFGFMGALGIVLCWIAAYGLLPALAAISERIRPMRFADRERRRKGVYGVLMGRVALSSPRAVLAGCALLTAISACALVHAARHDPLEYDFRNLQAVRSKQSRVNWVNARLEEAVEETRVGGALAVMARTPEDVPAIRRQLDAYRASHPGAIGAVRTVDDLLPLNQRDKVAVLQSLRELALTARPYASAQQREQIDEAMPPEHLVPLRREDLPASVARTFTERDGTMGRLMFVEHVKGSDTWDGRYMIRWAGAARSPRGKDGASPAVGGGAAVFADLLTTIFHDGPRVIAVSFVLTLGLLMLTFRGRRERIVAVAAMLGGVLWMTGLLALSGMKLNFLNMVALPITFGIGVEYPVNYLKRYIEEKRTGADTTVASRAALEGAGGAVILCSLTTLIGYISLYASTNRALNSFGLAMALGEVCCLSAAVVAVPALLQVLGARRRAGPTAAHGATFARTMSAEACRSR